MIFIAHRGNTEGPKPDCENKPEYIDHAIDEGYDVEVDVWVFGYAIFLGHDDPETRVDHTWIKERQDRLWIHCKNAHALIEFATRNVYNANYFWHQTDAFTMTSKGYVWCYPGRGPVTNSILVMPETVEVATLDGQKHKSPFSYSLLNFEGVCSDYVKPIRERNLIYGKN